MNNTDAKSQIDSLRVMITDIVNQKLAELPVTLPCKVVERNGVTVSVVPVITFGDLTPLRIDDVPILKSRYINEPVKADDFGFLLPSSYFYQAIVTDDKKEIEDVIPTITMGNYLFLPLSQASTDYSDGADTELWDKDGAIHLRLKDVIELNGNTGFVTEYTALNSAVQASIILLNAELAKISAAIASLSGSYTVAPVTCDISAAKVAKVKV